MVQYRPIELGGAIGKKLEWNLYERTFEPKSPKKPLSLAHLHAPLLFKEPLSNFLEVAPPGEGRLTEGYESTCNGTVTFFLFFLLTKRI